MELGHKHELVLAIDEDALRTLLLLVLSLELSEVAMVVSLHLEIKDFTFLGSRVLNEAVLNDGEDFTANSFKLLLQY